MKVDKARRVIQLGISDTKSWEDSTSNGYAFRSKIRRIAEDLATKAGKSVDIYASEKKGGWMADQVQPRDDLDDMGDLPPGTSRG
jgi:hypothetical protein